MSDAKGGMGANVGVRKIDEDGNVETRGAIDDSEPRIAWLIFIIMLLLDIFGIWKVLELIHLI